LAFSAGGDGGGGLLEDKGRLARHRLPFFNILEHKPPRVALDGHGVAVMSES
jgi:hypothetical protein